MEGQLRKKEQDYGNNPKAVRDTDQYQAEYIREFVSKWDSLIDWDGRAKAEGSFFIDHLKSRGVKQVLDVATGTGFHSVRLLEAGFEVVSADGSPEMLAQAFENGRERGHVLRTVQADWRWLNKDVHQKFDAIICLGNSFTHLFDENDRRKALAEFYAALRHDGVLILDQRNYDAILDNGYSSSHTYYYCGDDVSVKAVHVDDGLARFEYRFPDQSLFHLNMFPLRAKYASRLMREVGFQTIDTYGDFQETYRAHDPDFLVHVAGKAYQSGLRVMTRSAATETARDYYNSDDADHFYSTIWGGDDIHIGIYRNEVESISEASKRTVSEIASRLPLSDSTHVLDLGSGYCGAARHLAREHRVRVTAINLSEVENKRARKLNQAAGLDGQVQVHDGSFEQLSYDSNTFDVVWSQDAILHSDRRRAVMAEAFRVLKPGGQFVFTDPMQSDDCPDGVLQPILDRIHLSSLGSPRFYLDAARQVGFEVVCFDDMTDQMINHYRRVLEETTERTVELERHVSPDYIQRMKAGLQYWIDGGEAGYLAWGIFQLCKP